MGCVCVIKNITVSMWGGGVNKNISVMGCVCNQEYYSFMVCMFVIKYITGSWGVCCNQEYYSAWRVCNQDYYSAMGCVIRNITVS